MYEISLETCAYYEVGSFNHFENGKGERKEKRKEVCEKGWKELVRGGKTRGGNALYTKTMKTMAE